MSNLEHIYDILNQNNDDRITFSQFSKHVKDAGVKLNDSALRQCFECIANSVSESKTISKESWIGGIKLSRNNEDVFCVYEHILNGSQ